MPAQQNAQTQTKTFVLVHGAWHGGWCWARVAERLRALGHRVFTPTQTGLGERKHLLGATITLDTFVQDIANVLLWEDLNNVILVGHSFAGLSITGVADILPQRILHLVYLDAFILDSGISTFDTLPKETVEKLREAAEERGQGLALPAPKPKAFGLFEPPDIAFIAARLTPQPLRTYETALHLNNAIGNGLPCTYLHSIAPLFAPVEATWQWVEKQPDWTRIEIDAGHDAMVSHPDLVARHLLNVA
jgi:pimeloyl-ACP methyl ester carboxylesterase